MKQFKDEEIESALARHPLKGPREGMRERVLASSRAAWSWTATMRPTGRLQISWALSGWLAIAATVLLLLNIGADRFNRNAFCAQFAGDASMDALSHVEAVNTFAEALRRQKQVLQGSGFVN